MTLPAMMVCQTEHPVSSVSSPRPRLVEGALGSPVLPSPLGTVMSSCGGPWRKPQHNFYLLSLTQKGAGRMQPASSHTCTGPLLWGSALKIEREIGPQQWCALKVSGVSVSGPGATSGVWILVVEANNQFWQMRATLIYLYVLA